MKSIQLIANGVINMNSGIHFKVKN